ncbi:MAG: PepSY domain-containing protein [Pseudomonadota bacterium]
MSNTRGLGLKATAALVGVVMFPALAFAVLPGDQLGTTEAEIRASLEAEGFEIRDFDRGRSEIEVEVTKDGVRMEIDLTLEGRVKSIELD